MISIGAVSSISWVTLLVLWNSAIEYGGWAQFTGKYLAIMFVYLVALGGCALAGKLGGLWIRQRFLQSFREKQNYYHHLTDSNARKRFL